MTGWPPCGKTIRKGVKWCCQNSRVWFSARACAVRVPWRVPCVWANMRVDGRPLLPKKVCAAATHFVEKEEGFAAPLGVLLECWDVAGGH